MARHHGYAMPVFLRKKAAVIDANGFMPIAVERVSGILAVPALERVRAPETDDARLRAG
jgi:hypothetical protein